MSGPDFERYAKDSRNAAAKWRREAKRWERLAVLCEHRCDVGLAADCRRHAEADRGRARDAERHARRMMAVARETCSL